VRLTWLGHASVRLDLPGVRILTDPLLRTRAGPLRRRGPAPRPATWAGVDLVLISHLHHDHAELTSLRMLPPLPLLTGRRNAEFLTRRGLNGVGLDEPGPDPDAWYDVGDSGVQVRLVRADHQARRMPHRPNDAYGHLVRTATTRIWVAGDTAMFPELAEIPELAGGPIDLAVVPAGGWGPRLSGGHLDGDGAAQACALVGARAAMPYHWGTFYVPGQRNRPRGWMDRPGHRFSAALPLVAPGCRPLVLRPGQCVDWHPVEERTP
jgi:L-ascorbate metabolism protein UlaG (beta-lactamase superfamily)